MLGNCGKRLAVQGVVRTGSRLVQGKDSRLAQEFEMLGYGGLGQRQRIAEITATAASTTSQVADNLQTNRMAQRFQAQGQLFLDWNSINNLM